MDDELEAWRRATPEELLQMCVDDRQRDDEVLAHVLDVQFNLLQDLHHLVQDERQPVRRRKRSKASMMASKTTLWSGLPAEIVERVLSFLPVPDLCRNRAVCKRWNSLICSPRFGELCLQNANQDSYYIIGRYIGKEARSTRIAGWCILDLNARRWYTFKGDLVSASDFINPLAMDGGLVCQHLESSNSFDLKITVFNPLAKSDKVLPVPPCHSTSDRYPHVNLVVDSISNTYKIFLINRAFPERFSPEVVPDDRIMRVFESTTNEWRSLADPPVLPHWDDGEDVGIGNRVCSVMFQGLLYVLFKSFTDTDYWLFSYNPLDDTWKETGMDIQGRDTHEDILVVSDSRLFLVMSCLDMNGPLAILELVVANQESKVIFQMRRPLVMQVLNVQENDLDIVPHIHAFGFDKSIVLASRGTGFSIVYDLESCSFDLLPPNPAKRHGFEFEFFCGKPMNQLRLPSSLF